MTAVADRWRLHRGGIVNIWQYDEQEFDFAGGRAILQGTNGSGKSRTLELLLPLCLDGDLRQLGSKGFDTVSIRRLMLDEYDGGPNRIGYAWIELRRVDSAGVERFITCGLGLKASATSQQVSDSWRFITDARVGVDLSLAGPDRVPLGPVQLKERIGADRVLDDAVFRARIAEIVYGMPAGRYGDLLHLQRTLRNPDVGLKVLEGQLEQILSDALPPLDTGMIEQLAGSFEDLESIRENITRLTKADTALSAFLAGYGGYAFASLRSAADRATAARKALDDEHRAMHNLTTRLAQQRAEHDEAEARVSTLEQRDAELEHTIDSLKQLPAYQGMRDLSDRERLVAHARAAAESALETATKHRTHADRAVETVLTVLRRFEQDAEAAGELAAAARRELSAAGLDPALCPHVPIAPKATPGTTVELVRAKPDPEAEPVQVERRTPPPVEPERLDTALRAAAAQAAEAGAVATQRSALTLALHERAVGVDRQGQRVDGLRQAARQAQLAATESVGRRNEAAQRLEDAVATWAERARVWTTAGPFTDGPCPVELPSTARLRAEADIARTVHEAARDWATPRLQELRQAAVTAGQQADAITARIATAQAELAAAQRGVNAAPPLPAYTSTPRNTTNGAAFYELVDFAPTLPASKRAGLEAALQASGLLAAWVQADGKIDTTVADLFAQPRGTSAQPLSAALIPAVEPGSAVPATVVARILAAVTFADDQQPANEQGLVVTSDGRWQAGVLAGAMTKQTAEFVGAGARSAARTRRCTELKAELADLANDQTAAQTAHEARTNHVTAWERHLDSFPDDRALIAAHANVVTAGRAADEATTTATRLRSEYESADQQHEAVQVDLTQTAAEAGLPADTETLQAAYRAAMAARGSAEALRDTLIGRCVATVRDLTDALHDHQAAVEDLGDAAGAAETQCAEFAREAMALSELTSAIGGEAEEVAAQLTELEEQRRAVRASLPAARTATTELSNQVVKTETLLEGKQTEIIAKTDTATTTATACQAALAAPGALAAAFIGQEIPDDPHTALSTTERRGVSEEVVITKLQALQAALAGSYDITPERHAGILTVTVSGEHGPRPVAEAAALVSGQLAEQRGYLGERYQDIFATFMLRNLAERLHGQIAVAEDLTRRMNEVLDVARSSQGVHVRLEWRPSAALDETTQEALKLVRLPFAERTEEQDAMLRRAFTERIDAERETHSGGYAEILTRALDYRTWHTFTVRVADAGPDGKPRTRRMRQLSSGETRLVSYVTLFAAAAAFYGAISGGTGQTDIAPLRLVLLDEAFERLDDPTIARMLGLLVDLDMDWIITWPSGWGVSNRIPTMHIYDVLRPKSGRGVACTHTTWNGAELTHTDS